MGAQSAPEEGPQARLLRFVQWLPGLPIGPCTLFQTSQETRPKLVERKAYNHIDLIRAVLILMVILVHIVHFGTLYPRIREVIFVFFMPTFLLLTGYLTNVRKNVREFALYELRILLPYCIMVTAFASLSLVLPVRDGLTELTPPHCCARSASPA